MTYWTTKPWYTVGEAAAILRVHPGTLYDACATGDFPHIRFPWIRIPCEALRMRLAPEVKARSYNLGDGQLELPLDPACLVPVRRYRNTREIIR